ncbi:MAG: recombinase family protein, partial [Dysosmobacter sp.]|nr:recombinase family protein [Dysosmobacter sp.]
QSYNLSKLHTAGLLDAGALTERQIAINAKLAELRRRRRKLLDDEDIDEQADTIRQTVGIIQDGPEGLDGFDESLFTALVEQITLENQNSIRFRLYGGLEFRETLEGKK